ncbi:hypothetical protein NUSPORA_00833 [Nucleospora cyclopteri]
MTKHSKSLIAIMLGVTVFYICTKIFKNKQKPDQNSKDLVKNNNLKASKKKLAAIFTNYIIKNRTALSKVAAVEKLSENSNLMKYLCDIVEKINGDVENSSLQTVKEYFKFVFLCNLTTSLFKDECKAILEIYLLKKLKIHQLTYKYNPIRHKNLLNNLENSKNPSKTVKKAILNLSTGNFIAAESILLRETSSFLNILLLIFINIKNIRLLNLGNEINLEKLLEIVDKQEKNEQIIDYYSLLIKIINKYPILQLSEPEKHLELEYNLLLKQKILIEKYKNNKINVKNNTYHLLINKIKRTNKIDYSLIDIYFKYVDKTLLDNIDINFICVILEYAFSQKNTDLFDRYFQYFTTEDGLIKDARVYIFMFLNENIRENLNSLKWLDKAIEIDETYFKTYIHYGNFFKGEKEAIKYYEKALEMAVSLEEVYVALKALTVLQVQNDFKKEINI